MMKHPHHAVLFYKPQGVIDSNFPMLAEDTFLLVIMTAFQALLFSGRIVCLDSTHKTNQYRFKLLMVVIPDEYRKGNYYGIHTIVCMSQKQISIFVIHMQGNLLHAWALSDKEDTNTLERFWSVIRKRCPSAAVTTLMTDDGMPRYYLLISPH